MPAASKSTAPRTKHFAPKRENIVPPPLVEFSIDFVRDGVSEVHEFAARPRMSYGDTVGLIKNQDNDSGTLPFLDRLIRRSLVNDDGVPAKWAPEFEDGEFTAPDGSKHPSAELAQFTTFEAGSSRRRWAYLLDKDDDVEVEIEQIVAVFEYLTSAASEARPTKRSSPSSR